MWVVPLAKIWNRSPPLGWTCFYITYIYCNREAFMSYCLALNFFILYVQEVLTHFPFYMVTWYIERVKTLLSFFSLHLFSSPHSISLIHYLALSLLLSLLSNCVSLDLYFYLSRTHTLSLYLFTFISALIVFSISTRNFGLAFMMGQQTPHWIEPIHVPMR